MPRQAEVADVFDQVCGETESRAGHADAEQASAETSEPTSAEAVDDATAAPIRFDKRSKALLISSLLALVSLGAAVFFGWQSYQHREVEQASAAALQAARDFAVVLTTLDSAAIDETFRQTLDGATGDFKDAYSQGSAELRQILIDNKAAGTGIVIASAVKSATATTVEVLLFVDQSITNAANSSPRIDRNRIEMTMVLIEDRWLASAVEIL